jgi:Protein of unknown function (DUF3089)
VVTPPSLPIGRRSFARRLAPRALLGLAALAALVPLGCHDPAVRTPIPEGLHSPFTGYESQRYRDARMWLCRPDLPADACRVDLTETELHADGSRAVVPRAPAASTEVDCFYVYPTLDLSPFARNHEEFDDITKMRDVAAWQAAHFSEVCSVYAPLYRQATIGAYLNPAARREAFMAVAFSDVEDAFLYYMSHFNHGRKVVLFGHSQGGDMVVRLLQKRFDNDPLMREKLVVAMPIGWPVQVAAGRPTGGSFVNLPMCTRDEEQGCVVAYRSHRGGEPASAGPSAPDPGKETMCVNPGGAGGDHYFRRTIFPVNDKLRAKYDVLKDIKTPYVSYTDFYAGRCVAGEGGYHYLEVRAAPQPGDRREAPLDLESFWFGTQMGLHVLDLQFPQGDLVDLVRLKMGAPAPGR